MSAESLSLIAGTVLSLAFSYVPGLHERFEPLEATKKRLILLILLIASAAGAFALACSGWGAEWGIDSSCDRKGVAGLIEAAILAIVANQGVYALTPRRPEGTEDDLPRSWR